MPVTQAIAQLPTDPEHLYTRLAASMLAVTATPPESDWTMSTAETFGNWLTDARDPADEQVRRLLLAACCDARAGTLEKHHTGGLMTQVKQLYIWTVKHL
jgi:hypothetical protein